MTDQAQQLPFLQFIRGRSRRPEFWLSVAGLFAFNFVMGLVGLGLLASFISLPVWLLIGARRLHDFGRTGWWAVVPAGVGFVLGFLVGIGLTIAPGTVMLINAIVTLVSVIAIGSIPGSPGANRFDRRRGQDEAELSQGVE